jgi:hypothetical protein
VGGVNGSIFSFSDTVSPEGVPCWAADYSDEAAPPFRRKLRHLKVGGFVKQY